jgi:hypothetical protein
MGLGDQRDALAAIPPGKTLGTNRTGGRMGFRVHLNGYEKPRPIRGANPEPSSPQRVALSMTLFRRPLVRIGAAASIDTWKRKYKIITYTKFQGNFIFLGGFSPAVFH